jgi:hypothetical protein
VPDEIKKAKFKKGENVSVHKDKMMIMKRKENKDICLMSVTHDKTLVQTRVQDQDVKKPIVVTDCYSMMRGVDMSGT